MTNVSYYVIVMKVQKGHTANREGSFKIYTYDQFHSERNIK